MQILGIVLAVLLAACPVFAQSDSGRILGAVRDQSGGSVAGASVTITDMQRGVTRSLTTDNDGVYVAPNLTPGTYEVRIEAKGFKSVDHKNILVEVGKDVRIDIEVQAGSTSETITVTAEIPLIDTTTTTLGGTLSNAVINDLPLNGRNYQNLLTLRPGVMIYPGGGPWTQSTNGVRPEDMGYSIDGIANDEGFWGLRVTPGGAAAGAAATLLPIDAIQEFNTQVNPKAEYGWKPGAVTSVGLKSGTNDIHGTAYAFGRSDAFDARNFYNTVGSPKTPVELEQWGGTVGGPIVKDKLFYFSGFERQTYSVGSSLPLSVPTTAPLPTPAMPNCSFGGTGDCANSISDATNDLNRPGGPGTNSTSVGLLPYFGNNSGTSTNFSPTYANTNSSENALGKMDYQINDRHKLSGTYFFGNDSLVAEDSPYTSASFLTHVHSRAQVASGRWTWTPNSRWVNELRFGYTRYTLSIQPGDQSKPVTSYGLNTGVTNAIVQGLPNIVVGGFTPMGNFFSFPKYVGPDSTYDFTDQVSYLRGKHAFKFGGQIRDTKVTQGTWRRGRGELHFASLEDFLTGTYNTDPGSKARLLATSNSSTGVPTRHLTQWGYAGFIQDDWRATSRVTLNLGLRYEYSTPPSEANNLLGNFDPNLGMVQVNTGTNRIPSIYNGDHSNFSPRLGISWDVKGDGKTVIRAGYSLIYDLLTMNTFLSQQNTQNAPTLGLSVIPTGATIVTCPAATCGVTGVPLVTPPTGTIVTTGLKIPASALGPWPGTAGLPIFPASATSTLACGDGGSDPGPCSILGMDRNYTTPYVSNWTVGVQHAFSNNVSLEVAYVGNHGSNLTGIRDLNQPDPITQLGTYSIKFPYLAIINQMSNLYRSNYNGLQATLTTRNYHGLGFILGYTYSHALDNMSYNWNQYLPQDSNNPLADYASSDFDIRHRFTLSLTYAIPGKKTWGQLLEGWQINSILTLQTGQPWNIFDASNNISNTGEATDRWNFSGNPASFVPTKNSPGIPYIDPSQFTVNAAGHVTGGSTPGAQACFAAAGGNQALADQLINLTPGLVSGPGCYVMGNGVMTPPLLNTFGTMGRNIFRDRGFDNLDLSIAKNWKFKERLTVQFRAEFFNILNHPNFANPWGGTSGFGPATLFSDPSASQLGNPNFGCSCATPDQASVNPVLGSGGARAIQLGLKILF